MYTSWSQTLYLIKLTSSSVMKITFIVNNNAKSDAVQSEATFTNYVELSALSESAANINPAKAISIIYEDVLEHNNISCKQYISPYYEYYYDYCMI